MPWGPSDQFPRCGLAEFIRPILSTALLKFADKRQIILHIRITWCRRAHPTIAEYSQPVFCMTGLLSWLPFGIFR